MFSWNLKEQNRSRPARWNFITKYNVTLSENVFNLPEPHIAPSWEFRSSRPKKWKGNTQTSFKFNCQFCNHCNGLEFSSLLTKDNCISCYHNSLIFLTNFAINDQLKQLLLHSNQILYNVQYNIAIMFAAFAAMRMDIPSRLIQDSFEKIVQRSGRSLLVHK